MTTQSLLNLEQITRLATTGTPAAVDTLMQLLISHDDVASSKLIDYALGLIETASGSARLKHYLFYGESVQRNFAALYFKRLGAERLLAQAFTLGLIDYHQGYAR